MRRIVGLRRPGAEQGGRLPEPTLVTVVLVEEGAHGVAEIYTGGGGFAVLRKISIRAHAWLNWLYPLNV